MLSCSQEGADYLHYRYNFAAANLLSDTRLTPLLRILLLLFILMMLSGGLLPGANTPLMAQQEASNQKVVSFTLINAVTDQDIATLTDDYIISCNDIGTLKLNIRANTQPQVVGSVRFALDDIANYNTENNPPYAVGANNGSDYKPWTPFNGFHTLKATPYTASNAQGEAGQALIIHFIARDCVDAPTPTPTNTLPPGPTATPTFTETPSPTLTGTLTDTPTDIPTDTPTMTFTATSTGTITDSPTFTPTITEITATPALTLTDDTPTATETLSTTTPTATFTPTPTFTATGTIPTATPTYTTVPPTLTGTPIGVFELLRNGRFEEDADEDKVPDYWEQKNVSKDKLKCNKPDKPPVAFEGSCAYQFKSGINERSVITQSLSISSGLLPLPVPGVTLPGRADSGDTLTLSGYLMAKGEVKTKVKVLVFYRDSRLGKSKLVSKSTTPSPIYQALNGNLTLVMAGEPAEIKIVVKNRGLSGKVRYDNLSLLLKVE